MIAADLRALLPEGTGMGLQPLAAPPPPLWPGEAEAVTRAVPTRQLEFAAGRAAARAAMRDASLPEAPLPRGPARAPLWPPGVCGSISHTGTMAGALAARCVDIPALGLDLEEATPLDAEITDLVRAPGDDDGGVLPAPLAATLIFSAKEAAFKAQFPLSGLWLDYRDVAVTLAPHQFRLTVCGIPLAGRWTQSGGLFLSVLTLTPDQGHRLAALTRPAGPAHQARCFAALMRASG